MKMSAIAAQTSAVPNIAVSGELPWPVSFTANAKMTACAYTTHAMAHALNGLMRSSDIGRSEATAAQTKNDVTSAESESGSRMAVANTSGSVRLSETHRTASKSPPPSPRPAMPMKTNTGPIMNGPKTKLTTSVTRIAERVVANLDDVAIPNAAPGATTAATARKPSSTSSGETPPKRKVIPTTGEIATTTRPIAASVPLNLPSAIRAGSMPERINVS